MSGLRHRGCLGTIALWAFGTAAAQQTTLEPGAVGTASAASADGDLSVNATNSSFNSTIAGLERMVIHEITPAHIIIWCLFLACCCSCCCFTVYNRRELKVHHQRRTQQAKMEELVEYANQKANREAEGDVGFGDNLLEDGEGLAGPYESASRAKALGYEPPSVYGS
eukprot:CAMPEP_0203969170 /NCGR_PEP_ID=MMETSP0359-20131031/97324_1 /ASSEMBLY_ACC=CAM_ASM_000338 /TAXON_ID=268821 /ORGANISM="Scrippsiella Hangoei, Strain SHTV-5" /LENGTH=166 /DNA_ID=CAMNT_0050907107 /DNA_START=60 /DNA_END=560 /DNA_ORIENTATION=-